MKEKNRRFIDKYQIKNDGSIADRLMKGMKKFVADEDKVTPAEKRKRTIHYKQQMRLLRISMLEALSDSKDQEGK